VEGGYPTNKWWDERGSWHLAVDGRGTESCWQSWRGMFDDYLEPVTSWNGSR